MKKHVVVSLADSNYFPLLDELINSIKRFNESNEIVHRKEADDYLKTAEQLWNEGKI